MPGVSCPPRSRAPGSWREHVVGPDHGMAASPSWCMRHSCLALPDLPVRIGPRCPSRSPRLVGSSTSPGVGVGHAHRLVATSPARRAGRGVARTGVTVLDPGGNGFGRRCRPAARCSTVRRVHRLRVDAGVGAAPRRRCSSPRRCRSAGSTTPPAAARRGGAGIGVSDVVIPLVAECDDSSSPTPADAGQPRRRRARRCRRRAPRSAPCCRPTRARSAPAPACRASTGRAASGRRRGCVPSGHVVGASCSRTSATPSG